MSEQVRRPGRPRKWEDEAARKRAYRQRRAAELARPLELREAARVARAEATRSGAAAGAARQEAERWQAKAVAAFRRAEAAEQRAAKESERSQQLVGQRDEARRLLRRKLQWAKHAEGLRKDPDALLVLVAELYAELEKLRKEVSTLRQQVQRPATRPW